VKYVDGLVLLAKEEMELYGMLVGVGKHYGIEMNVEGGSNENFDTAISWRT
jgi:hypothetical protein